MNLKNFSIGIFLIGGVIASLILYTLKRPNPLFENDLPEYKEKLYEDNEDKTEKQVDKLSNTNKLIRIGLSILSGILCGIGFNLIIQAFVKD